MDEEITIIDANTRKEKIKNFFLNNKKNVIIFLSIMIILLVGYFSYDEIKERNKIKLANQFNLVIINFKFEDKQKTIDDLIKVINQNDVTYSPLALYFLLDNNLIENKDEINSLFDVLIKKIKLEKEIKNLIIYKKALFNSNLVGENELIKILDPIINSESIWRSHGLYLLAEYFYSNNEKQKAKEFFNKILTLSNSNNDIKLESQKRINRDLSE
jgi:predicted negative regulator of RcsB-dependent stress response